MTFYLKYRPQTIDDLDISSVRDTLNKIVKSGSIPHAFLFAGTKGTGKTSSARILAKIINCEAKIDDDKKPCNKCDSCISITNGTNTDVIEMDAASNRGIDDIRTLRDAVKLAPLSSKSKIYIIDEAHMLTTEASNALLKTLEEPPAHVYFILATTNPEKLIDTIRSRTALVNFTKATPDEISRSLKRVVESEKIKIDEKELNKIAKLSRGSFRDAVKILEQFSKDEKSLTGLEVFDTEEFIKEISKKNISFCLEYLEKSVKNGSSVEVITEEILEELKNELLSIAYIGKSKYSFKKEDLIYLIELIIQARENIKISPIEQLPLEVSLVKWSGYSPKGENSDLLQKDGVKEEVKVSAKSTEFKETVSSLKSQSEPVTIAEVIEDKVPDAAVIKVEVVEGEVDKDSWNKILGEVKPINATIEALLRSSKVLACDGKNLRLGVYYKFHKDKLEELKNKKMLEDIATKIFNSPMRFECVVTAPEVKDLPKVQLTDVNNNNIMTVAEEIFNV